MTSHRLVASIIALVISAKYIAAAEVKDDFRIAGYWPDYRSYIDINDSVGILTDIILFSIQPDDVKSIIRDRSDVCCLGEDHYKKAREARAAREARKVKHENSSINLIVSVGGAGRSDAFRTISATRESRLRFIQDLKELCLTEELNGVDFDWEQPTTQEEYMAYMHLVVETSEVFHQSDLLVTLALHPGQIFPKQFYDPIDRIHLMAYDMIQTNDHHASYDNALRSVDMLIESGCDSSKIILGLPAYGRDKRNPSHVKTYSELIDDLSDGDWKPGKEIKNSIFGFESRDLIFRKVGMAMEKRLGGVFLWELGQDYRSQEVAEGLMLKYVNDSVIGIRSEVRRGDGDGEL